ncbi:MAG: hypothetical protein ACTHO8_13875 [Solirubrobacterales bacterium]
MSMLVAWIVYPLVLALLCGGLGLLVDFLVGRRLPGTLILPVGFAAIVVVGEFTTATDATAELTVPLLLGLSVAGAGLSLPWRFGRPDRLAAIVALGVFFVFGAPVIFTGDPTFAGYIKLDDTATWMAMTDRVMEHGRSLSGLEPSSYRATLEFNLAGGYPIGVFVPYGAAQKLVGGDLAWVFQPYLSFMAALLSLSLWEILGIVRRRPLHALAVFVAAQPALLFGYALWGGIKEVAAAALVALAAALAPAAVREGSRLRDVAPLGVAAAAIVGVLSPGGAAWIGPLLLVLVVLAVERFGPRGAAIRAGAFALLLVVLTIPVWTSGIVPPTSKPLVGSNGEGNLIGPLNPLQALGIWPAGDFRVDPEGTVVTAVLVGLGLLTLLFGLWTLWRRRAAKPLLYATALVACFVIVVLGSPWAGGKALATASPVALSLAVLGALAFLRLDRLTGWLLVVVVAGGVLWSNVLAYGGVNIAPYGQLRELERIGDRFAGEGPALMTEYNPYGARHFLRKLQGEGASELRNRTVPLTSGGEAEKGAAVDTDEIVPGGLFVYRTLVLRRSPVRSRPPSPYRLAWRGKYYEVWQRPEGETEPPAAFLPLGDSEEPAAVPDCREVETLEQQATGSGLSNVRLLAARHAPVYNATKGPFEVPRGGDYTAWLGGSVRGSIELFVDDRKVGEVRHQLQEEGSFIELGEIHLNAGSHEAELRFGGADLHPGSGGFPRPRVGPLLFAPSGEESGQLISVPAAEASQLCGKRWDWIEAIGTG